MKRLILILTVCISSISLSYSQNNALRLGADFDYIQFLPGVSNGSDFSFALWFNTPANSFQQQGIITTNSYSFQLFLQNQDLRVTYSSTPGQSFSTGISITPNEWTHLALTASSGTFKIYINGALEYTSPPNQTINIGSTWNLGRMHQIAYNIDMVIDEFEFWDVERTASEISSTYDKPLYATEQGLKTYYKFDQGVPEGDNTSINALQNSVNLAYDGSLTNVTRTGDISNFVESTINPLPRVQITDGFELTNPIRHNDLTECLLTIDSTGLVKKTISIAEVKKPKWYIGQQAYGGTVFHVYQDSIGDEHCMIISNIEYQAIWQDPVFLTTANSTWDAYDNTITIQSSPAKDSIVYNLVGWNFPTVDQMHLLFQNRYHINKALEGSNHPKLTTFDDYWTSTESGIVYALAISFATGQVLSKVKSELAKVRGIKEF